MQIQLIYLSATQQERLLNIYDLSQNDAVIMAPNPNPNDFVLTYHRPQAEANADTNPISATDAAAFTGTNGQTIYARFEYLTSGCYETSLFTLNIFSQPTVSPVNDLIFCDDSMDGDDTNGILEFDLDSKVPEVLGAQSALDLTLNFITIRTLRILVLLVPKSPPPFKTRPILS